METINLKINGIAVEAPKGSTILEAARLAHIEIPTLCFLKEINEIGACRICIVELKNGKLVTSCVYPAEEGMEVYTNTPKVLDSRKKTLQLLLSNHNRSCLSCVRSGHCELQELAHELGVDDEGYYDGEITPSEIDTSAAHMIRDNSKCILCRRCVAVCENVQGIGVIGANNRGFSTSIGSAFEMGLGETSCVSCGQCIAVCPTGALTEKDYTADVFAAIADPKKHVIVQTAPAVRAGLGEEFGLPIGTDVEGKMAAALRRLGFSDVMEVALGADVTSQREAAEFVERMERGDTFMTTSCCPAYVEAVRRHAPELLPHVSETATPMHYTAEIARERHPDTVTVFIGPCVAKRQEGLHDEMVDYVLTFEEVGALFNARGIVVEECEEHELEHPSNEARGYAIAGGVSAAVEKLVGDRFEVRPVAINGLSPQGLKKLQSFVKGGCPGNLVEVMTCVGGCVGGAGVVMPAAKGAKAVENFATKGKV